ncbi:hypothetical protein [Chengkuizengella marina]|uniref:Uncharacterized protein n=1 Tax=Chengkuizengella marina TaxID=2507566 RepID=A0A6N9Q0Y0_9BACL|nr:hypothetical protein [Chengkuizengella marina]NBI28605.1 hypothetical protein [Chengkuizengella marina]
MANKYGICRLDRISGTPDGRLKAKVDFENGTFAVQDEVNGELLAPTAVTDDVVLVASVAYQYDSMNEGDFVNKAGSNLHPRTFTLPVGDLFTVTKIAYTGVANARGDFDSIEIGDLGTTPTGTLVLTAPADVPANATTVVEVIDKTTLNGDNAVQVKVKQ